MIQSPTKALKTWVEEQLKTLRPGQALPTDLSLAKTFGLSHTTVRRVLTAFRKKGRLVRIPGKGTFVAGNAGSSLKISLPSSSVETIVNAITRSVYAGEYKHGEALPSIKQICLRFHASASTVIKAYKKLQEMELVVKIGKAFWVGPFRKLVRKGPRKEVFLFHFRSNDFSKVFQKGMLAYAYQKMERELHENGYVLRYHSTLDLHGLILQWRQHRNFPYGLIFFDLNNIKIQEIGPVVNQLYDQSQTSKIPIVVDNRRGDSIPFPRHITVLSRGNILTAMARELAHFFSQKQIKKAVYFYNQKQHFMWNIWPFIILRTEVKALNEDFEFKCIAMPSMAKESRKSFLQYTRDRIDLEGARKWISKYQSTPYEEMEKVITIARNLGDAYERAGSIKMWCFLSSIEAAKALDWASQNHVQVPKELSILCFENNPSYYHRGITACFPDWENIGYMMAHAIIQDFPGLKTKKGFLKIKAQVAEKLTTP